jgi:NADH-quinone oxidoreductase subunit F
MIKRIKIGAGSCGLAAGAAEVFDYFQKHIKEIDVIGVGCIGHCYAEPIVEVETDTGSYFYQHGEAKEAFLNTVLNLKPERQLFFRSERSQRELLKVTRLAGRIDPVSIDEYQLHDGYQALQKALTLEPDEIIAEVRRSGLRGRGGAGFPTGQKWSFLRAKNSLDKVLICNADEGDPGAFMDRSLMESVPHQILEGMLIAAYATGATQLFIYCRAEYPLAVKHLRIAIQQIVDCKLNQLNERAITILVKEGAGAFVCGEETAMIHSLEGNRGTPHFRPPYPTDSGYQGFPTMINNVETFANIPLIITEGSTKFAEIGIKNSKGTKLFALAGDLKYPGLVEVPMGITLSEVVYEIGGAEKDSIKAVQIGGPSGGCIPATHFDVQIDYDSLKSLGAIMGSGGLIFIGNQRCMVDTARYFLDFTTRESCGKCIFCRVGTKRMLETLDRITHGQGETKDLELLENIGTKIIKGSLCGLGQSAPNPVLTTLKYYRLEYEQHVNDKQCQAMVCNALVELHLDQTLCIQCNLCIKNCPVNAISEEYVIDNEICTRCNSCIEVCPKDAIKRTAKGVVYAGS